MRHNVMTPCETILVADIGGTNARFAFAIRSGCDIAIKSVQHFKARDFDTIEAAVSAYLDSYDEKPDTACFAVAGPIAEERVSFTNSHWCVDVSKLMAELELQNFSLVNDFAALSMGVPHLVASDIIELRPGQPDLSAPRLVIGPGTGFGQAILLEEGDRCQVISTEGGHVSFAPQTDEEMRIFRYLSSAHDHVSVERLLSGQGLVNIYTALADIRGFHSELTDPGDITALAFGGEVDHAAHAGDAVRIFCNILGSVTGDAVLSTGARGGVFLGGGIVPKIYELLKVSAFKDRFIAKGRMRSYLEPVPVSLISAPDVALRGAAVSVGRRAYD